MYGEIIAEIIARCKSITIKMFQENRLVRAEIQKKKKEYIMEKEAQNCVWKAEN